MAERVASGQAKAASTGARVAPLRSVQARMFHQADCSVRSTAKRIIRAVSATNDQRVQRTSCSGEAFGRRAEPTSRPSEVAPEN